MLGRNVVVDDVGKLPFYSAETFFANAWEDHPITDALAEAQYPVIFSLARGVRATSELAPGAEVTELVRTSASAWGETSLTYVVIPIFSIWVGLGTEPIASLSSDIASS